MNQPEQTRAIVLHHIKYGDTSLIVHLYTEAFGRCSIIIKGAYAKKSATPAKWFQPLFLVEGEIAFRSQRELQSARHLQLSPPLYGLGANPVKSGITLFLGEFLAKVLREEEGNPLLFGFLHNAIRMLDASEAGYANFHLLLLIHLTKYLGFFPRNDFSPEQCWFDLEKGHFTQLPSSHNLGGEAGECLSRMLAANLSEMEQFRLQAECRNQILDALIAFYSLHHGGTSNLKSIPVVRSLF